mmetsp:Transcript_10249/g.15002  ORF Transcript_10249/g.15002 Transcript_10249/m.15002 type:complete len:109 (-) Transcript_10249:145-471(-)|eukprot:CAMPEP_0197241912 /NCGR_PEP_ID=MMETSP1429-20130617/7815_1 /TAXON_ID=49237 /ORGANISM="Chaetoceros  sp., Strain UNC1202" /LENGTH=108 /DNA_ID=CAMNT_0042701829 /DNA_START=143 /DNA_END=469 /DNA_ORIENTATION=+
MGCCFSSKKFQGEGNRLGFETDNKAHTKTSSGYKGATEKYHDSPPAEPTHNPNLTNEEREDIRAQRAAAAEARLKKNQIFKGDGKKKKVDPSEPLRGPNSKNLMNWQV